MTARPRTSGPGRWFNAPARLLVGVSLAIAGALWAFLATDSRRSARAETERITAAMANTLPLHDPVAIAERCNALSILPEIASVNVYDRSGSLLASYVRPGTRAAPAAVSPVAPAPSTRREPFTATAKMVRDGEYVGEVRIAAQIDRPGMPYGFALAACSMVLIVGIAVPWAFTRDRRNAARPAIPAGGDDPSGDSRLIHQSLLEHLPIFVYRKDPAGRFIYVSAQYCGLMRRNPGELLGRTILDVESGALAQQEMEQDQRMAAAAETVSFEARFEQPGEPIRFFQVIKTPVRDATGRFVGTQGMGLEITSLKQAQAEVARVEARFRFIFDAAPVGLAWMEPGDVATRVTNRQYGQITGVPNEQSHQLERYRHATHPDDRKRQDELHAQLIAGEIDKYVLEKRYLQPDGSTRWAMITVRYMRGSGLSDVQEISALVDITERKQAEAELERLHKQLVDTSRQAGMAEVATSVLHNIGNVLNSVNVSTTLLLQHANHSRIASLGKLSDLLAGHAGDALIDFFTHDPRARKIPDYVSALHEALSGENRHLIAEVTALKTHIEHISEVVRMQQDYATVAGMMEPILVTDVIEDALRINENAYGRHGIVVVREFAVNPTISTDRHRVLDILVNLLQNAKNACVDAARTEKSVRIAVTADATNVCVTVMDNGVGIAPENLTRIFAHGFTTRPKGHGFGLHSSAVSAKAIGGSLAATSAGLGTGATLTLQLPLVTPASAAPAPAFPRASA